MSIAVVGKLGVIAFIAAIAAWLPPAVLVTWGMDAELRLGVAFKLLLFALVGSFAIGLPVACLCAAIGGKSFARGYPDVALAGFSIGFGLIIVTMTFGGSFGAILFGVPAFIASNVYAAMGWFWILRPMRILSPLSVEDAVIKGA